MKLLTYNNELSPFIIEVSEGIYIKEYSNTDWIGYTTNKDNATRYDLASQATEAMNRFKTQAKDRPIIVTPQDITEEVFPDNDQMVLIVAGYMVIAALAGALFVKIIQLIFF